MKPSIVPHHLCEAVIYLNCISQHPIRGIFMGVVVQVNAINNQLQAFSTDNLLDNQTDLSVIQ